MNTPVSDLLHVKGSEVFCTSPDSSIYDAVKQMSERGVGSLLVCDASKTVQGIVAEHDCRESMLRDLNPRHVPVRDIMSAPVLHVEPHTTLEGCMQLMTEKRVRHLPVMDGERLCGMISIGDVVKWLCSERQLEIENLEKYITGSL